MACNYNAILLSVQMKFVPTTTIETHRFVPIESFAYQLLCIVEHMINDAVFLIQHCQFLHCSVLYLQCSILSITQPSGVSNITPLTFGCTWCALIGFTAL